MPVQPMKAIAATALSDPSFDIPEIMAAGILTAAFILLLGVTRLMKLVYWLVPLPLLPAPRRPRHPARAGPQLRHGRRQVHTVRAGP